MKKGIMNKNDVLDENIVSRILYSQKCDHDGNYTKTIKVFKEILSSDPNCTEAYTFMGESCGKLGQMDLAISSHKKTLSLDPNYNEAIKIDPSYLKAQMLLSKANKELDN